MADDVAEPDCPVHVDQSLTQVDSIERGEIDDGDAIEHVGRLRVTTRSALPIIARSDCDVPDESGARW